MLPISAKPIHFGPFLVTPQVFYTTHLTFALVNIKPLLPGHVLVIPKRRVPRISDLTHDETTDLFLTVRRVAGMIEKVYNATSLNVAIQDGVDAGQSVPHLHTHIIPRQKADMDDRGGGDALYELLDGEDGDIGKTLREKARYSRGFPAVDNDARKPRSEAEMNEEAARLHKEMQKQPQDSEKL